MFKEITGEKTKEKFRSVSKPKREREREDREGTMGIKRTN